VKLGDYPYNSTLSLKDKGGLMPRIIARKYNGDDSYSWAIFVEGQSYPIIAGLQKNEVPYYKKQVQELLKKKGRNI
jgi:hypothetical protein